MTAMERAAAAYRAATDEFVTAGRALAESELDVRHPDGWSARQVIHHLADAEVAQYVRLMRLLAEDDPRIPGFDEEVWARCTALGYSELPVDEALSQIAAVRARAATVISRLQPKDLDRTGQHSERGQFTVAQWIDMSTRHAREHAQQLAHAVRGEL